MNTRNIFSTKKDIPQLVTELKEQLNGFDAKMIIYFASSNFDQEELCKKMGDTFSSATIFGCSTAGEFIDGKVLEDSVVAMAFNPELIEDVKVEVAEDIKNNCDLTNAFNSFEAYFDHPMSTLDFTKYVGIVLTDGLSGCEERIMEIIGAKTNVTFVGGSAGDNLDFVKTYVYANGKAYTNAVLLALIKPKGGFDFIKTQSFTSTNKKLTCTKSLGNGREVAEFNNKPAAEAYKEALGVNSNNIQKYFLTHPVALVMDDEMYVRSIMAAKENGNMTFYCSILEGMNMEIVQATDIVEVTKKDIEDKIKEIGNISALISFNCVLRKVQLQSENKLDAYANIFANIPSIGLSTYGEAYLGHINQTSTMLVFK